MNILDKNNNIVISTPINEGSVFHYDLMGEHYIQLVFNTDEPVSFNVGDYINTEYGIFELLDTKQCTYNASNGGYEYRIQFQAYYRKWGDKIIRYSPSDSGSESGFSLTAPISQHILIVTYNLSALGNKDTSYLYNFTDGFTFSIDNTVDTTIAKYISYENTSILDSLTNIAEAFGCEWWVDGSVIHFGRCESGVETDFILGQNGENVESMSSSKANQTYATRIYAYGSERNLPPNYRASTPQTAVNGIVQRRLMLPENRCPNGYLQLGSVANEVQAIEKVVYFDEVYPKVECEVGQVTTYETTVHNEDGSVTTKTYYRVTDVSGFNFSTDMILDGETLHIHFETGKLSGMEFECYYDTNDEYYEVVMNSDYGTELPDSTLHPESGDIFVLYGWDASMIEGTNIIGQAEDRLYNLAAERLASYSIDPNAYTVIAFSSEQLYGIGRRVRLVNKAYFENGRSSRIIGVEFKLDIPSDHPRYTVGENAAYSRSGNLEEKINDLRINGINIERKNDTLSKYAHGFDYLKRALNESTSINGGLILSSLIQLGYTNSLNERVTMSGMNGLYDTGKSIAFWAGGDMNDMEYPTAGGGPLAQYVMRMDGSGYMAGGNIKWSSDGSGSVANGAIQWDANGNITQFKNTSNTVISQFDSGIKIGSHTLLEADLVNISQIVNKVDNSFFNKLFTAIDANGNAIPVNGSATPVKIRANFDFFSVGESSAFGIDSSGGGGGGGLSPEGMWSLLGNNDSSKQINISHLTSALANYALSSSLATVATSGSYNDLSNKPTIPAAQIQSNWNQTTTTAKDYIKNKPTKVSAFTNDANYVTSSSLNTTLASYVTNSSLNTTLASYATQTWVTNKGYATTSAMNTELAKYLPLAGGTMSNTNLVTNLNADLLDGKHASELFTDLSNSGNNISLTIGGTTNTLRVAYADTSSAVGELKYIYFTKNDNSGYPMLLLVSDVSEWYSKTSTSSTTSKWFGMIGNLIAWRAGSMARNYNCRFVAAVSYYNAYYRLQSDNSWVQPLVVSYDSKYYLALKLTSASQYCYFLGYTHNLLDTFIKLNYTSSTALPSGVEIIYEGGGIPYQATSITASSTITVEGLLTANGNIKTDSYIEIGDYRIVADTANTALKVVHKNGTTAVNFYATGENSALGVNTSGGGGGGDGASLEAVWTSLGSSTGTYGTSQINASHLTTALNGYATQSWVTSQGYLTSYTETDPVFTASAAHGITSTDITSWNSKPSRLHGSMAAGECVRIQFNGSRYTAMVFVRGGQQAAQLVLVGTGYGTNTTRNQWTQLSNDLSNIVWSIPKTDSITRSIELKNEATVSASFDVVTFDGNDCTITKIDELTTAGVNNPMIDAASAQTLSGVKTFSAQIKSTVATGTAPLVVASSTLVSNLNADKLDGVDASGLFTSLTNSGNKISVTIGGTNKTLQVGYATSAGESTTLATARTIWGQNFDGSANVSGNMTGVGSLDASDDITVTKSGTSSAIMKVVNGNGAVSLLASVNRGVYDSETSKWVIGTNGTNTFLMDGNVGINTTSPQYKLHVASPTYSFSSIGISGGAIYFRKLSTHTSGFEHALYFEKHDSDNNILEKVQVLCMYSTDEYKRTCLSGTNYNNSAIRIDGVGTDANVGIGIATAPSYKLHVDGDAYATKLYLNGSNFLGGNSTQLYAYIGTANPFVLGSNYVRRGTSDTDVTLGTSSYRWANLYSVLGNFSGQITSSVATGTSPLSVASTTLNENLNADLLDGYHATEVSRLGWVGVNNATGSSDQCKWYEVNVPTSSGSLYVYDIIAHRNAYPFVAYYRLAIYRYNANVVSVSLVNHGFNHRNANNTRVCVAIDSNQKVYIQSGSRTASNYMRIRPYYNAGGINTTAVGEAAFGTADGFTALKMVTDSGYFRVDTSASTQSTAYDGDPMIRTSVRIGNAYLWWDDANNCLRITGVNSNGVPTSSVVVNVNVSGEVTALKTS